MKMPVVMSWIGTGIALVLGLAAWDISRQSRAETAALRAAFDKALAREVEPKDSAELELVDVMAALQRHSNKLYFAGQLENWPLAGFYLHEIQEAVEEIKQAGVRKGEVEVNALLAASIEPEVNLLKAIVKVRDREGFLMQYHTMTDACNACHQAMNHPYIVINEPRTPAIDNQNYAVSSTRPASD